MDAKESCDLAATDTVAAVLASATSATQPHASGKYIKRHQQEKQKSGFQQMPNEVLSQSARSDATLLATDKQGVVGV